MMLTNGLSLFIADIIDEETNEQTFWYVIDKTYDSALQRFINEANCTWDRYAYYFYEADEEVTRDFVYMNEDIGAGIYDC